LTPKVAAVIAVHRIAKGETVLENLPIVSFKRNSDGDFVVRVKPPTYNHQKGKR
jgi:hypothetical protein